MTTKSIVSLVSFSSFVYNSAPVINKKKDNDDQEARAPSIQFFAN